MKIFHEWKGTIMDLKKLRILLLSIKNGSFTKAAKELDYTPSGVVHMMNALEDEIGFPILERSKSGVSLNQHGEQILPFIQSVLSSEDQLTQAIQNIEELKTGKILIGSYPSIASSCLPRIIKLFNLSYPNIEIEIIEGIKQEITDWLDNREIDLAFISYKSNMKYDWTPLFDDQMVVVLPLSHTKSDSKHFPVKELTNEKIIMPAKGYDEDVIQIFEEHSIRPNIKYKTQENQTAISMVENELGISVMNKLITAKSIANVSIIPLSPPMAIKLGIATTKSAPLSPATIMFMKCCIKELRKKNL